MLTDLQLGALTRVLRPTMLVALVLGAGGVVVAVLLNKPWGAVGIAVGVGLAILNLRMLGAGVVKVQTDGEQNNKVVKRILRTRSAVRLTVLTLVAIGAVLISPPFGIGMIVGLVIFQISFVVNAGRAILREGIS
jgi:uncharacterized membrane protein YjjP (DUF1212 family)